MKICLKNGFVLMHNVRWENTSAFDPARAPAPTRRGNGNAGPYQCFSGLRTGLWSPRLLSFSFSLSNKRKVLRNARSRGRSYPPSSFASPFSTSQQNFLLKQVQRCHLLPPNTANQG